MLKKEILIIYLALICFIFMKLDVNAETINIIYEKDSVTSEVDYHILEKELKSLGYEVRFVDLKSKVSIWWSRSFDTVEHADINIFIEGINSPLFQFAKQNFLIPNPKYTYNQYLLQAFDLILCQTEEQLNIFEDLNLSTYYLGFTSDDRFQKKIKKDFNKYLYFNEHFAEGAKGQIFNETVFNVWSNHTDFPLLLNLSQNRNLPSDQILPNVKNINDTITQGLLTELQNRCGIHIYLNQVGGYCHSIMQGMSAGSVIVTIDAPPMKAFIQDERCLVKYQNATSVNLGTHYDIDPDSLENVITNLINLSADELKEIGLKNRDFYDNETEIFRNNLKKLFGQVSN